MDGLDLEEMFAMGAKSAALDAGLGEERSEMMSRAMCKKAKSEEDDDSTLWGRNKWWMIPAGVGAGAWWLGSSAQRFGRPDRGYLGNTVGYIWDRVKKLLGINDDPVMNAYTTVDKKNLNK